MNHMKRMLAMLLALVMIVGVLPMSVFADQYGTAQGEFDIKGNAVDALVVFSDLHLTQSSSTNSSKFSTLQAVLNQFEAVVVSKNINITSVNSSGDMFSVNSSSYSTSTATLSDAIQTALPGVQENYVWSDHDRTASEISKESGFAYGFGADGKPNTEDDGNYYVYLLSMADLSSNDRYNAGFYSETEIKAHIATFEEEARLLDDSKPLFIVGHQPLYDRRDDNAHALKWVEAINRVASTMDVAYFHGHNHKYDVEGDYYHAKGSTMTVLSTDGKTYDVELNFTHINAGYLSPASTYSTSNTTREGTAIGIIIYDNAIEYVTYNQNGQYTGNYKLEERVARKAPQSLSVTGKIDYQVGDSIQDPTAVEVTYTNGAVSELTNGYSLTKITKDGTDYTVEGFTFPEAGTYTLTYTCTVGNYQAQAALNVTVVAAAGGEEEPEEKPEEQVKLPVVAGANVTEVKDVTSQITPPAEEVTNYLAYDFTAEMIGETAIVSIPVPSDWVVGDLNAYYVDAEGNITDESFEVSYVDGCAVFTVTHFSTYVLTNTRATLNWVQIPGIFRLVDKLTSGKTYVIVSSNAAGNGTATNMNNNAIESINVQIFSDANGVYIMDPGTTAQWLYNTSGRFQNVSSEGRYLRGNNNALGTTDKTDSYTIWSYDNDSYGLRTNSGSTYRYMTSVTGTTKNSYDAGRVYIFEKTELQTGALYAAMDGLTSFTFGKGEYNESFIRSAIKVYTASDATGTTGKAEVKDYTLTGTVDSGALGTYELTVKYGNVSLGTITVTVSTNPYLKITEGGEVKDKVVRVHAHIGDKIQLGVNAFDGTATVTNPTITWSVPSEYAAMASVDENGMVTILNNNCDFFVEASWTTVNGDVYTDRIEIGVSPEDYLTPNVSDTDFPDYPNQGAIRYDKTATAVGNFSETGVAQMELSMTGIPYGKGVDVVVVIDTSSSMRRDKNGTEVGYSNTNSRYYIMKQALRSMLNQFDGNNVDLAIVDFNGYSNSSSSANGNNYIAGSNLVGDDSGYRNEANKGKVYTGDGNGAYILDLPNGTNSLGTNHFENAAADAFNESRINQILGYFSEGSTGTNYDFGLECAYKLLAAKKAANGNTPRDQYVIFLTDGSPFRYNGFTNENSDGRNEMDKVLSGDYADVAALKRAFSWMSDSVAAMYNPVNGTHPHRMAEAIKGTPGQTYQVVDSTKTTPYLKEYDGLGAKIYSIGFCIADDKASSNSNDVVKEATSHEIVRVLSSGEGYYWEDLETVDALSDAFVNIAKKISEAATNIVVTDKIAKDYTMIFGIPQSIGTDDAAQGRNEAVRNALSGKDLYIEVVNYTLNSAHERTGTVDSLTRIYLKDSNGTDAGGIYSAAIDNNGTAAPTLTFAAKDGDKPAYWAQVAADYAVNDNDIVVTVNGQKWKFTANGEGTHNVASGAYAHGTIHEKTNMSDDLVIVTPYFAYSAKTKMLAWTIDKVEEFKEIALRYFLYLDDSSTEIGTDIETPAGTYKTNEWAYLTYTNHLGHECRQEFPKPQMTWNGAQVSYVFYLVNEAGQPVNKAGQVVDFANAVFVTDIFTKSVVWNDTDTPTMEGVAYLDATWAAKDLLPSDYQLFDTSAYYELYVYADTEELLDAYFKITGSEANGYKEDGEGSTTKVYITKADTIKYDKYGTYTEGTGAVHDNFDFANTTVAFAVVWKAKLVEDTVVVDFGLDVLINVIQNDFTQNSVDGISKNEPSATMGTGIYNSAVMSKDELVMNGHTISIASDSTIRFHQGNMLFDAPISFYYESKVNYHEGGDEETGYLYTKVTVIPATTIYYEDSFIAESDLKTYAWAGADWGTPVTGLGSGDFDWKQVGKEMNAIQQQDRPGKSQISAALDADNSYGYDAAYKNMSTYSMGSALKVHVDYDHMATASFSFYGTGFDVISLTTNTTGTIVVNVYDSSNKQVASHVVNTYYGMKYEGGKWVATTPSDPAALYQVPVMKISGLTHGQYRAEIKAVYDPMFDQGLYGDAESYDFYLDAVRVYDPTGNKNQIANDAYVKDGEAWPTYAELRDLVIDTTGVTVDKDGKVTIPNNAVLSGLVFIDGMGNINTVQNYISYGPNNELYLASGQSIAFALNKEGKDFAKKGFAVDKVQLAIKSVGGTGHIVIKDSTGKVYYDMDVTTATDMYYDISALDGKDVLIQSTGSAIISMTNIKVTYKVVVTPSENGEPPVSIMSLVRAAKTEEEETYLISVNAEMIERVLNVLNGKVEVKPERPFEPAPGKPSKPGSGNKPGAPKPSQPIKPSVPAKPIKPVRPVVPTMPVNPGLPAIPGRPAPVVAVHIY